MTVDPDSMGPERLKLRTRARRSKVKPETDPVDPTQTAPEPCGVELINDAEASPTSCRPLPLQLAVKVKLPLACGIHTAS